MMGAPNGAKPRTLMPPHSSCCVRIQRIELHWIAMHSLFLLFTWHLYHLLARYMAGHPWWWWSECFLLGKWQAFWLDSDAASILGEKRLKRSYELQLNYLPRRWKTISWCCTISVRLVLLWMSAKRTRTQFLKDANSLSIDCHAQGSFGIRGYSIALPDPTTNLISSNLK